MSTPFKACALAGFLLYAPIILADDLSDRQRELKQIQSQINAETSTLENAKQQVEQLAKLLEQDEQAIAKVAKKANDTQQSINASDQELLRISKEQKQLQIDSAQQQKNLSEQIVNSYLLGKNDQLKLLLNQKDPNKIDRVLVYYQYMNQARMDTIKQLRETITQLEKLASEEQAQKQSLVQLRAKQQSELNALNQEQEQREKTLAQLKAIENKHGIALRKLQDEQQGLKDLVDEMLQLQDQISKQEQENSQTASQPPVQQTLMLGLSAQKGQKFSWPTKGKIRHHFGRLRSVDVPWKGTVIGAPEGQEIEAIAPGTIIYADWMRGFGMVMVIDHGKGDMSLYGQAQALLKSVGDTVNAGETIALVGRSGGQSESGLYFEIRHKGQAKNPAHYCR